MKQSAAEGDATCGLELESLNEALKWWSRSAEYLPPLTQLETGTSVCVFSLLLPVDVQKACSSFRRIGIIAFLCISN